MFHVWLDSSQYTKLWVASRSPIHLRLLRSRFCIHFESLTPHLFYILFRHM
jgi:hypothetical protein